MRVDVQKHVCCGGNQKHLTTCNQNLAPDTKDAPHNKRPLGKVNVVLGEEPLLPHSVEVQHNWTDAELYPHSSFTFKPAQPLLVKQGVKRKKRSKEVESQFDENDEYSSSEDEGEVFIRGALNKKKRGLKNISPNTKNPSSIRCRLKKGLNERNSNP
jgi:hypothetical protein